VTLRCRYDRSRRVNINLSELPALKAPALLLFILQQANMSVPLQYAPWISDIELAFYSSLASIKINHDRLESAARKVLGQYEINPKDSPERSTRMQIHGNALTTDE